MRSNRFLLALCLMLLAPSVPAGADVLGRKTMTRPYNTSGYWCQTPYRWIRDFGPPLVLDVVEDLYAFTAPGPDVTLIFEALNLSAQSDWHRTLIDNVVVARSDVFQVDSLWAQGGCDNGSLYWAHFDFSQLPDGDPRILFKDTFINAPRPEWTGVGSGAYWSQESSPFPSIPLPSGGYNGSLGLGLETDPARVESSLTLTGLTPGVEYAVSFLWSASVPEDGSRPELSVLLYDTPRLASHAPRLDSIEPEPGQPTWAESWDYFHVDVPEGSHNLVVDLYGLSADADLYVRHGNLPDLDHADCIPYLGGTESERCVFELPEPGRWWIGVVNYDPAPISYQVRASWDEALDFYPLASPCRVLDTRNPPGLPLASGWTDFVVVAGQCGVPLSAKAVSLNVTAVAPTGGGYLSLWPANLSQPGTSVVNFPAGRNRANNAILGLATDGWGDLAVRSSVAGGGTVHLIVDVNGYFQ